MSDQQGDVSDGGSVDGPQQQFVRGDGLDKVRVKATSIVDGFFRFASNRNLSSSPAESDSGRSSPKPSSRSSSPSFKSSNSSRNNTSSNPPLRPLPVRRPSSRKVKFKDDKSRSKQIDNDTDTPDTNDSASAEPMQSLHTDDAPKRNVHHQRLRNGRESDDDVDASANSIASWNVNVKPPGSEIADQQRRNTLEDRRATGLQKKTSSTSFLNTDWLNDDSNKMWFEKYMPNWIIVLRAFCGIIVLNDTFQLIMVLLIVANAICMGLATFDFIDNDPENKELFEEVDFIFLCIFTVELGLQFGYWGYQVFTDAWLLFDVFTIGSSWVLDGVQVTRSFRIFRAFRLVVRIPILKSLVYAVFHVIPRISSIMGLFALLTYIYAVMATTLYKDYYHLYGGPDQAIDEDYFGRLDYSLFTLFQFVTLENWSAVVRGYAEHDYFANVIFGSFLTISGFILYSLVVAVVCDSFLMVESKIRAELKAKAKADRERRKSLKRRKGKRNLNIDADDTSAFDSSLSLIGMEDSDCDELDSNLMRERGLRRRLSAQEGETRRQPQSTAPQKQVANKPTSFLSRPDDMPDLSVSGFSFLPSHPSKVPVKKRSALADLDELLKEDDSDDDWKSPRPHTFTTTATSLVKGELERKKKPEISKRKKRPVMHRIKRVRKRLDKLATAQSEILSTLDEMCKELESRTGELE